MHVRPAYIGAICGLRRINTRAARCNQLPTKSQSLSTHIYSFIHSFDSLTVFIPLPPLTLIAALRNAPKMASSEVLQHAIQQVSSLDIESDSWIDSILNERRPRKRVKPTDDERRAQLEEEFLAPSHTFSIEWLNKLQRYPPPLPNPTQPYVHVSIGSKSISFF